MPPSLSVETKLTDPRARPPDYATPGAAGMDLRACLDEPLTIAPGETVIVGTGIAVFIRDSGYVGLLAPRSGWASSTGLFSPTPSALLIPTIRTKSARRFSIAASALMPSLPMSAFAN